MFGGMAFCYGLGVVDSAGAFAGFSNTGVLTVALMVTFLISYYNLKSNST